MSKNTPESFLLKVKKAPAFAETLVDPGSFVAGLFTLFVVEALIIKCERRSESN